MSMDAQQLKVEAVSLLSDGMSDILHSRSGLETHDCADDYERKAMRLAGHVHVRHCLGPANADLSEAMTALRVLLLHISEVRKVVKW